MKNIILFVSLLLLNVQAFAQADTIQMDRYSFLVPEGWKIKEGCMEADCSLLAPHDDYEDTFLENINIVVTQAPGKNYAVKKYADFSVGYLPTVIDDFEILERIELDNNGEYVIYKGFKSDFHQTWKQYYFIKDESLYIITFTAETSRFEEYISQIQINLDSFKIK